MRAGWNGRSQKNKSNTKQQNLRERERGGGGGGGERGKRERERGRTRTSIDGVQCLLSLPPGYTSSPPVELPPGLTGQNESARGLFGFSANLLREMVILAALVMACNQHIDG